MLKVFAAPCAQSQSVLAGIRFQRIQFLEDCIRSLKLSDQDGETQRLNRRTLAQFP